MTGLFGKLFGKKKEQKREGAAGVVEETAQKLIDLSDFNLSFDIEMDEENNELTIEFFGEDEEMVKEREGQLLDAFQLYFKRVVQHRLPESRVNIVADSGGFREEANQALKDLADKLKDIAIDKNKSVYFRALPPKDRKTVHQYLASDGRIKSRSIGDGHFKKIKIYPAKGSNEKGKQRSRSMA